MLLLGSLRNPQRLHTFGLHINVMVNARRRNSFHGKANSHLISPSEAYQCSRWDHGRLQSSRLGTIRNGTQESYRSTQDHGNMDFRRTLEYLPTHERKRQDAYVLVTLGVDVYVQNMSD